MKCKIVNHMCINQDSSEKQNQQVVYIIKRFITRNCFKKLWRLTCPKSCGMNQKAGEPEQLMEQFQSLGARRAYDVILILKSVGQKFRKNQCARSCAKAGKIQRQSIDGIFFYSFGRSVFLFYSDFQLIRYSPTTYRGQLPLLSLSI